MRHNYSATLYLSALPALLKTFWIWESTELWNLAILEHSLRLRFGTGLLKLCAFGVGCAVDVAHINFRPSQCRCHYLSWQISKGS